MMSSPAKNVWLFVSFNVVLLTPFVENGVQGGVAASGDASLTTGRWMKQYKHFVDNVYLYLSGDGAFNITETCRSETRFLLSLAEKGDKEALKFLNASGRHDDDASEKGGNFFGSYSECWGTQVKMPSYELHEKYCIVEINDFNVPDKNSLPLFDPLRTTKYPSFGFCLPSSCEGADIQLAVSKSWSYNFHVEVQSVVTCTEKQNMFSDLFPIAAIFLLTMIVVLVLYATAYDILLYFQQKNQFSRKSRDIAEQNEISKPCEKTGAYDYSFTELCLLSFSLKRNIAQLCMTKSSKSPTGNINLNCLHGMRFFAISVVVLFHTFAIAAMKHFAESDKSDGSQLSPSLLWLSVHITELHDVFFFMSGILLVHANFSAVNLELKRSIVHVFVHRIVRLTPLVVICIVFCAGFLKYGGFLPNWSLTLFIHSDWCRENWWSQLTFFQNFIYIENTCLPQAWHNAADLQLSFFGVVALLMISRCKNEKYGHMLVGVCLVTSIVSTFASLDKIFTSASNIISVDTVQQYYVDIHVKPYCHILPFFAGIYVACLLMRKPTLHLKQVHLILMQVAAANMIYFVVFGAHVLGADLAAVYHTIARIAWVCFLSWVVIESNYGYGGLIDSLATWKVFAPLSRLGYSIYLINPMTTLFIVQSAAKPVELSLSYVLSLSFQNLMLVYPIAALASLFIEMPFIALESAIRRKKIKIP